PEPPNAGSAAGTRIDGPFNYTWGAAPLAGVNGDGFSVNWIGAWRVPESGLYRFHVRTRDDGIRLEVAGAALLDQWNAARWNPVDITAPVFLPRGSLQDLRLHFYDRW